ncbi:MAG: hypothetical protein NTW95_00595 [Candidatus Aminicenantes bacterium]|nr:hypothetical protein [Candidatus Aminicenantes bacterium]
MKKNLGLGVVALAVVWLIAGDLAAITVPKKKQFTLRGGLNLFSACGSASDYRPGENDFPVNPAFTAPAAGIGLTFFSSPSAAIGFDVAYGASANVDLRDPADGETIRAATPKSLMAACSLFQYLRLSRRLQFSVSLGAGAEMRMAKGEEYISDLGSRIIISAPAPVISPLAVAGIGWQWLLSREMAVGLECRAFCFFRGPVQFLVSPALTLGLKF